MTGWLVIGSGTTIFHLAISFEIPVVARMIQYPNKRFLDQAQSKRLLSGNIKVERNRNSAESAASLINGVGTVH